MRGFFLTTLAAILLAPLSAQEATAPPAPKTDATFFSGSVVVSTPTQITVHHRALASNATTKTFVVDSETKIEGKLRLKVNVTVQYVVDGDGRPRAVHIIVR